MFTWYAAVLASFVVALPLMVRTTGRRSNQLTPTLSSPPTPWAAHELKTDLAGSFAAGSPGNHRRDGPVFCPGHGGIWGNPDDGRQYSGKTNTLPLTIYTLAGSGDWPKAQGVVLLLTAVSGVFLYLANRYGRKTW